MTVTAELPLQWTRPRELVLRRLPISKIDLPPEYERKDLVEDDAVGKSIARSGVQQPVVVIAVGALTVWSMRYRFGFSGSSLMSGNFSAIASRTKSLTFRVAVTRASR